MNLEYLLQQLQHSATVQLFAGVFVVLVLASSIAAVLRHKVARGAPHAVIDNLVARINAWWVMIGFLGVAFALGRYGMILMFAAISAQSLREYLVVADARAPQERWATGAAFAVVLPIQYGLIWIDWYNLYAVFIPVYAFLLLPIIAVMAGMVDGFLARTAKLQWGLMVCIFCISHIPALVTMGIPGYTQPTMLLIAWLIIVVQGSDVLQYIWGKLLGRHKVAPVLSPSKTWEGLVGGITTATAMGAALYWITPFLPWQAAGMALVVCLMGFLGGLVMSAIKRDRNFKDWGHLIEGHGGMLDRLDSLLFAAPIYFHLIRYWWTP